ncbi:hypothetical protein MUN81_15460 [Hymenobacter sp. 5317J-9]|uniref:hypothetical protein n=1 Tax=Hymenobacter sp. 5317J-9 TaxID=2932250 RepID=UPI001FD70ADD|nr:hypothetical protein [Hymenobacter sp. 5317J-9]UOQ96633.1 hypothetical protein MUN81_15460 [Hymenobacter sp. 5317J-9]
MSASPVFAIPVRAHVRQFLLKEFGPDIWQIHQNTFLGRTVRMKVEKLPYRQLSRPEVATGTVVRLSLPTALKHYTLTVESAKEVGEMLDKFFQQQMIQFVKGQVAVTQNERAALRSFYKLYDINPSDYDLEEARKVWRDYKDRVLKENGHFDLMYLGGGMQLQSDYAVAS